MTIKSEKSGSKRQIDVLFGSAARVDVIFIFLMNPDRFLTHADIVNLTGRSYTGVDAALNDLEYKLGLIKSGKFHSGNLDGSYFLANPERAMLEIERDSERHGVTKYLLNTSHPWIPALRLLLENSIGTLHALREEIFRLPSIDIAFVYGSFARNEQGPESDVDVIFIGHQTRRTLSSHIGRIEKRLGRQIDFRTYAPDEWRKQYDVQDHFVRSLMSAPKLFIVGDNEKLEIITTG